MATNIWEERSFGFLGVVKPFKKERNEEIDQLINLGCNFLQIMDSTGTATPFALKILDTPYGVIHDYNWAIGASTFLMPNQDEAIVKIAKMVVDLAKAKNLYVSICESTTPKMREIFWQLAQLEGLEINDFEPSELLINRLKKEKQLFKIEEKMEVDNEQDDLIIYKKSQVKVGDSDL